ncbi:MAG: class GN sortase [Proteobacteria bacterium]|nr:class GN sortase [Pseudomonadota bacterium]
MVAQQLLNHSWQLTIDDQANTHNSHRPWPWADTWPVAKLRVPQHGIEQIVLAGDSGSSLAFGPGLSFAGATPDSGGITMISGHRDTHFNFLKDLKINDRIYLQTRAGGVQYHVESFQIVDSETFRLPNDSDDRSLVLVTCYPFEAATAGGSLRYLVRASPIAQPPIPAKNIDQRLPGTGSGLTAE